MSAHIKRTHSILVAAAMTACAFGASAAETIKRDCPPLTKETREKMAAVIREPGGASTCRWTGRADRASSAALYRPFGECQEVDEHYVHQRNQYQQTQPRRVACALAEPPERHNSDSCEDEPGKTKTVMEHDTLHW